MTNQLTTIASLPGSGAGSMSALPVEIHQSQKGKAPDPLDAWFQPVERARVCEPAVNVVTMAFPGEARAMAARIAERMVKRPAADRQGFEPFAYTERS